MNRKNTILLAVMINAGLLVVLFVTAITSQEEVGQSSDYATLPRKEDPAPLFIDELDLAMRHPPQMAIPEPTLPQVLPEIPAKSAETPIVHALPAIALEPSKVTPVPHDSAVREIAVKKGDTLEKIAKEYRTTVDEIIKLNQLPSSFLRVSQILRLPQEKIAAKTPAKPVEKATAETGPEYYTVKVGDNPWTIAMKHHLKVDELLKLNALNEEKARRLKPGDRLRIR